MNDNPTTKVSRRRSSLRSCKSHSERSLLGLSVRMGLEFNQVHHDDMRRAISHDEIVSATWYTQQDFHEALRREFPSCGTSARNHNATNGKHNGKQNHSFPMIGSSAVPTDRRRSRRQSHPSSHPAVAVAVAPAVSSSSCSSFSLPLSPPQPSSPKLKFRKGTGNGKMKDALALDSTLTVDAPVTCCHNLTRKRAIDAVKKEQKRQSSQGICDQELLATIYQGYSITSVQSARKHAQRTAHMAAQIYV